MKRGIILIGVAYFLCCGLACCKKNSDASKNSRLDSELSFDIDGRNIKYSGETNSLSPGVGITKINTANPAASSYVLQGNKDSINFIIIQLLTDSLTTKNYELAQGVTAVAINGDQYMNGPIDRLTVTITSYQNGIVSGSFNGTLAKSTGPYTYKRVTISNGILKDIRVNY